MSENFDVIVIGAGPTGLACAIDAKRVGLSVCNIDKGCLTNSLYNYPTNMTFFTTPELLEIGDIPFPSANPKPNRQEALEYYRRVAEHYQLEIKQYEPVEKITGADGDFRVHTIDRLGETHEYSARKLILSTGYYDLPNYMNVPGEHLPKVSHYYKEPHAFWDHDVLIVGAKNSASIAALELWRHGARVTMVHRGPRISDSVKYWIKPDIENRIKNGEITAYFNSTVKEVLPEEVVINTLEGELRLKNDFVLALTGYHPDFELISGLGIRLTMPDNRPEVDPATLESNVPGVYLAGVLIAGNKTGEIFIENGRFHGGVIAQDLRRKLGAHPVAVVGDRAGK